MTPAYALSDALLLAQCDISSSSTHGPGGQHRNKVESAARLRHRPSGIVAQCESAPERSLNRAQALVRLRLRLAILDPSGADPEVFRRHRHERRIQISAEDPDFPVVVASCLEAVAGAHGHLGEAALALQVTSAQLSRLLSSDKEILAAANRIRLGAGIAPLHGKT